jgi:hypothetical protein
MIKCYKRRAEREEYLFSLQRLNPRRNKCSWGINLVIQVLRSDDDAVVADVISGMANDQDLGSSNKTE